MAGINLNKAMNYFKYVSGASKWTPKTLPNGTKVSYVKGENGVVKKIVERTNGTKITAKFNDAKQLLGTIEENARGKIDHYFGAQNYNKIINVKTNRGEELQRMAHTDRKGFLDYNYNLNGTHRAAGGDYTKEYKDALAYVRNNGAKNAYQQKNDDAFLKFCARWAK